MKFVGVDLAWGFKRPSALCVLSYRGHLLSCEGIDYLTSMADFSSFFTRETDRLCLAIDAPLRVENDMGNRAAEKEASAFLRRFGCGILPVNRAIISRRYPLLPVFWRLLDQHGFKMQIPLDDVTPRSVFEVFPPLIVLGLWGQEALRRYREAKKRKKYSSFLKVLREHEAILYSANIKVLQSFIGDGCCYAEDALDAFLCAYAAFFVSTRGRPYAHLFGLPQTGFIVMPLRYPKSALVNFANSRA